MKYTESKEQSAELLRLLLPLMSKHGAAFHPISYAVWYEYISGINLELKQALDRRLQRDEPINDTEIRALFQRFISDSEMRDVERLQVDLRRVLDKVTQQASAAGQRAEHYGSSLGEAGGQLVSAASDSAITKILQTLMHETREMQGSVTQLQTQLRASGDEVESLRQALHSAVGESMTDPLTGLKNRRGLDRVIVETQSAKSEGLRGYALMMVDVDHFKRVNDRYGHLLGDKVLRSIAQALDSMVRGRDAVARFGGEEFALLLPETEVEGARLLADRIRRTIENGRIKRNNDSAEYLDTVTVSIGVAGYVPGETVENFFGRADHALYACKQNGRNRVMVADPPAGHDQIAAA